MRKIFMFNMITLDGLFEGQGRDISWHRVDEEFNTFAGGQLDSVDVLLFGRITYQLMAAYWPSPMAIKDDPVIAEKMNSKSKIVFSKSLEKVEWNNTRLIKKNVAKEVTGLKNQFGKDLIIFGSANLCAGLAKLDLIDEYRLVVNPIVLGAGRRLFDGFPENLSLQHLSTKTFGNGNVLLRYQPNRNNRNKGTTS